MTHNRKPDVLPVEGASIAEALETLSVVLDAHSANLYRLLTSSAGRELVATVSEHNQAALATIRSALERAASEREAAFRRGQRDGIDRAKDATSRALNLLRNSTLRPGDIEAMLAEPRPAPPKGSTP